MDKTTQHLVDAAKDFVGPAGGAGLVSVGSGRAITLRAAIRNVEDAAPRTPVLPGDYGVKFVGVSAAGQAILKIVGGPEDGRRLFTPLPLLFPPLFKVSVDHVYWKGVVSNRVRRVEGWKGQPSKFPHDNDDGAPRRTAWQQALDDWEQ